MWDLCQCRNTMRDVVPPGLRGDEETDELAEVARVPVAYVVRWVRDCEERGLLLPASFR